MTPETRRTLIRLGAGAAFIGLFLWVMTILESVAVVILVAFFLAYILDPAVNRLTGLGLSRSLASGVILIAGLALVVGIFAVLIPAVFREISSFAAQAPRYFAALQRIFEQATTSLGLLSVPQDWDSLLQFAIERGRQILPRLPGIAAQLASSVFASSLHLVSILFHAVLVPVVAYYLLASFSRIKQGMADLIPSYLQEQVIGKLTQMDDILAAFVRGQLTISLILAGLYSIGFLLIGIDLAVVLGVISGLLFLIPYVGTLFAVLSGSIMALAKFGDLTHVGYVAAWIAVVQTAEGYLLTPRIVGEAIGLHPVVYILALVIGANLLGFVGMLIAIPLAAVLKVLLITAVDAYRQSYLYREPADPKA